MISRKSALNRFEKLGFNLLREWHLFDSLFGKEKVSESDFLQFEHAVRMLGAQAISSLHIYSNQLLAVKQLERRNKRAGKKSDPRNFLILLSS